MKRSSSFLPVVDWLYHFRVIESKIEMVSKCAQRSLARYAQPMAGKMPWEPQTGVYSMDPSFKGCPPISCVWEGFLPCRIVTIRVKQTRWNRILPRPRQCHDHSLNMPPLGDICRLNTAYHSFSLVTRCHYLPRLAWRTIPTGERVLEGCPALMSCSLQWSLHIKSSRIHDTTSFLYLDSARWKAKKTSTAWLLNSSSLSRGRVRG